VKNVTSFSVLKIPMNSIIVDTNIILNVWEHEENPKTGISLWRGSADLLVKIRSREVSGFLAISSIMELAHFIKVKAILLGVDPKGAIEQGLSDISSIGFRQLSADTFTMPHALSFIINNYLDPFDAILVSIAVNEGIDAIISRDKKLKKKASKLIPILTPEEFLAL
jgi:predicted nucleic acid-binding protein